MATIQDVLARLAKVRAHGEQSWMACCPAHADKNPSLSVSEGKDGRILFKCFAGCASEAIAAALGLSMADLMGKATSDDRSAPAKRSPKKAESKPVNAEPKTKKAGKPFALDGLKPGRTWKLHGREWAFVEWYDYTASDGSTCYRKLRFRDPDGGAKTFIQCVPVDGGLWMFGRSSHGVDEILYNLPEVLRTAKGGGEVWVVEGEKDVQTAQALGLTATCNADGAGKWQPVFSEALKGCTRVTVIADKDHSEAEAKAIDPKAREWWQGQRHAVDVCDSLSVLGIPWRALTLPDEGGFTVKDLSDWAAVAGPLKPENADALRMRLETIAETAPAWPIDTYRRSLREESSTAAQVELSGSDAGKIRRKVSTARGAKNIIAAGGMPHSLPRGGASTTSPLDPHTGQIENVGGAGEDPASVECLRGQLIAAITDKDVSSLQKKRNMCRVVCGWLGQRGHFYYDLADRGHGTAMWFDAVEKKLHRVAQDYFRSWLSRCTAFSREFKDYRMFISAVEDEAVVGDDTIGITPRRYWHREGDCIYLSCGEGRMVRINAAAVTEVDNGTDGVVFEQGYTLTPWQLLSEQEARDPFEACSVFSGISTVDGRGLMLVRLWFSGMFGVTGWKPLLVLSGAVGSGKTRVAVAMFQLLGVVQRVTAIDALGNVKDFWASVDKGGLFCLDNADHHIQWLPDALSVISTGGTFEKKKLYTDTETITQEARCWAVVTSANASFASDAGLSDRLITVNLERVERETAESVLTREIEAARDAGLTWLCHIMRRALADAEPVPRGMNRRHPDWAGWVYRLGRAAGLAQAAESAIRENESFKAMFAVQNDAFGKFLLTGVKDGFRGSADELGQHLSEACEGYSQDLWTVTKIGKALSRLGVALKSLFNYEKLNHSGRAVYDFKPLNAPDAENVPVSDIFAQPVLGVVGDVGVSRTKSPVNTILHDLLPFNPHIPHIPQHNNIGGEREEIEEFIDLEVEGWDG